VLVLWRGSASGRNRLQWRITTGGRLGRVHTLGEFGDAPRIGTDASGKTIAVWLGTAGVRTAARRVGEFTRPATVGPAGAQELELAVAPSGDTVAAWRARGGDVQSPRGTPVTISRGRDTAFGPVQPLTSVTNAGTLSVAVGPDGRAVLAFTGQIDDALATVNASYRAGRGLPFAAPAVVGQPQFVSTAWGASAAIDAAGHATVAWGGAGTASAARSDATGVFAPAQALAPTPGGASVRVLAAAGGATTLVAWMDTGGAWGALGS
jgi:hypothetical protein